MTALRRGDDDAQTSIVCCGAKGRGDGGAFAEESSIPGQDQRQIAELLVSTKEKLTLSGQVFSKAAVGSILGNFRLLFGFFCIFLRFLGLLPGQTGGNQGKNSDHDCSHGQQTNASILLLLSLGGPLCTLACIQKFLLGLLQRLCLRLSPGCCLGQHFPAQQKPIRAPLLIPQRSLTLQGAQVLDEPGCVVGSNRLHKTVMHQLDPGIAAANLPTHQEAFLQGAHHAVGQASSFGFTLLHQPARPGSGDQRRVEPGTHPTLADPFYSRVGQHQRQGCPIKLLERLLHISRRSQILRSDQKCFMGSLSF